jgi:phosphoglycerate kinase
MTIMSTPNYRRLGDLDVAGKRVLVRADLNVPMVAGKVSDTARLEALAPTLEELSVAGARIVVISHFGRPKGQRVLDLSLAPVVSALTKTLDGQPVGFVEDCIGPAAQSAIAGLKDGQILVLENLRFYAGEEADDANFAAELAALGDIYVNDAFSAAHRAHASTHRLAKLLPSMAGRLMERELDALANALGDPAHPVAAIVGGAKISTKLELLGNLAANTDLMVIGGGMANTFLNAKGIAVGKSLCEHELAETARTILDEAAARGCEILLPVDVVVAAEFAAGAPSKTVPVDAVGPDEMILDIGISSVNALGERLAACRGHFVRPPGLRIG